MKTINFFAFTRLIFTSSQWIFWSTRLKARILISVLVLTSYTNDFYLTWQHPFYSPKLFLFGINTLQNAPTESLGHYKGTIIEIGFFSTSSETVPCTNKKFKNLLIYITYATLCKHTPCSHAYFGLYFKGQNLIIL